MKYSTLYCKADTLSISASMASTWIWAPAIYVSSSIAYNYGVLGLLLFLVPNYLTIILFGKVAQYLVNRKQVLTFNEIYTEPGIKYLQTTIGIILLFCSTLVQLVGVSLLFANTPKIYSCSLCLILALFIVYKGGLKGVIENDFYKYIILFIVGSVLFWNSSSIEKIQSIQFIRNDSCSYLLSFGITTFIGLISAPYVDQTFWNRVAVIPPKNVSKTFNLTGGMFIAIPILFGSIGLFSALSPISNSAGSVWNISQAFENSHLQFVLAVGICIALMSTLDSNLCAFHSLCSKHLNQKKSDILLILFVLGVLGIASICSFTITDLFLIYGTIRTSAFIPCILVIFKKYDYKRLLVGLVISILLATIGYNLCIKYYPDYAYIITVLVLLVPLIGYKK